MCEKEWEDKRREETRGEVSLRSIIKDPSQDLRVEPSCMDLQTSPPLSARLFLFHTHIHRNNNNNKKKKAEHMLLPIILSPGPWRHFWDLPWETPTLRSPRHLSFSVTDVKTIEVPYTKSFSSRDKLFCSQRTRQKLQSFRFYKSGFSISTIFDSDFFAARHTIKVHSTPEPLNKGFFFVSTSFWKNNKLQIFSQCTANE